MTREQRQSVRKRLNSDGILSVDGTQHHVRCNCHVQFALDLDGQMHIVAGSCHVIYCFLTHERSFRAGLQFLSLALNGAELIERFIAMEIPATD